MSSKLKTLFSVFQKKCIDSLLLKFLMEEILNEVSHEKHLMFTQSVRPFLTFSWAKNHGLMSPMQKYEVKGPGPPFKGVQHSTQNEIFFRYDWRTNRKRNSARRWHRRGSFTANSSWSEKISSRTKNKIERYQLSFRSVCE